MATVCLVVDASALVRTIARGILEALDMMVLEAADDAAALALCREVRPDVIMIDAHVPRGGSLDLIRALRTLPHGDRAKVFFCSTELDPSVMRRAIDAGANGFLAKPFVAEAVSATFLRMQAI